MTFRKGSRYENARRFEPDDDGHLPFSGVRARQIGPATPVIEHEVTAGDRLDLLALHYYQNDRLWWRIADANPEFLFAGPLVFETLDEGDLPPLDSLTPEERTAATRNLRPGSVILIPKARE